MNSRIAANSRFSFSGPVLTAGQSHQRQDGASIHPLPVRPAADRPTDAGSFCPLPKGARPPRKNDFRPLLSGSAAIMLNTFLIETVSFCACVFSLNVNRCNGLTS